MCIVIRSQTISNYDRFEYFEFKLFHIIPMTYHWFKNKWKIFEVKNEMGYVAFAENLPLLKLLKVLFSSALVIF